MARNSSQGAREIPDPFEFQYLTREPAQPLRRFVESIWYARGTVPYVRERIAPTGSTVAVIVLGDPIIETPDDGRGISLHAQRGFLIGPHDRPVVNEPTGETFAVGIVCTPVGCASALGVAPAPFRSRVVDLESVWPEAIALRARLIEGRDPAGMLAAVERHLARAPQRRIAGLDRCERGVAMLEEDPMRPIADIATELGVSHGYLDREFIRIVGLGPRVLARLLRMRRLLDAIDVASDVPWADVAADLGWFDQAHLIRDFRRHTGVTPTQYLEAQRTTFTPDELGASAGFVPQVGANARCDPYKTLCRRAVTMASDVVPPEEPFNMTDPVAQSETQLRNIESSTGVSLAGFTAAVREAGLERHGQIMDFLKARYGLSHGNANLVALRVRDAMAGGSSTPDDLLAAQYADARSGLLPIYEALAVIADGLGGDVQKVIQKSGVSFRRTKQFALVQVPSAKRVQLGLNLGATPDDPRVVAVSGMCTHRVDLTDRAAVDADVASWMRAAYERAG